MSVRARLSLAVAGVLVVTLVLLGFGLVQSTRATLVDQVDEQVRMNADRFGPVRPAPDNHDASSQPPVATATPYERTVARFVYSASGALLVDEPCGFTDDPKPPPKLPPIPSTEIDQLVNRIVTTPSVDGSLDYRLLVQRSTGGSVVVTAASLSSVDAAVARMIRMLIILGLIALAAATLASWFLIRRGLRPVDRMIDTADAIASGDLSQRVPDADPRTELGRLGRALNEMLGRIEEASVARAAGEQRLRRFVADAAHELRTPLTSLRGYAELYRQGALAHPDSLAGAMRRIEGEGARMSRLVDDLLLLARLDQQRGLDIEPVDLVAVVREALADFHAAAPDRPLTEHLVEQAEVRGDRIRLRQIIDNLLANARTHTLPGTPVEVGVAIEGANAVLAIHDDGPGIPAEQRERIFERFWRADPSRRRDSGGAGLGLSIVASLAEAHGGRVAVESEPGTGATFVVTLPLISAGE